jgi:hypothetical protein
MTAPFQGLLIPLCPVVYPLGWTNTYDKETRLWLACCALGSGALM